MTARLAGDYLHSCGRSSTWNLDFSRSPSKSYIAKDIVEQRSIDNTWDISVCALPCEYEIVQYLGSVAENDYHLKEI